MSGPSSPVKGRGATFNPANRFRREEREAVDDGWTAPSAPAESDAEYGGDEAPPPLKTTVTIVRARSIIAHNESPDIPFNQSINPYQGCEHGCIYCYARPSHAYLDLSPGLDFETKLYAKPDAAELLKAELSRPGYVCDPIALGTNTDPYQPLEREWKVTRSIIQVLAACNHPLTITTKGALADRDIDLLAPLGKQKLVHVFVSVTSLDNRLASTLEPRASAPHRRLKAVETLNAAGVPCGVMVAPIIPMVTDKYLEKILEGAAQAGATAAGYTIVRLPYELKHLFREWLALHVPERTEHVMSLIQQMRGGRDNDANFGSRMRGEGQFAELIRQRFQLACRKYGIDRGRPVRLDTTRFTVPRAPSPQRDLFCG